MTKKSEEIKKVIQVDLIPRKKNARFQDLKKNPTITRKDAMNKNFILYWNGEACEHGHFSPRYVRDGVCKECYAEYLAGILSSKEMSRDIIEKKKVKKSEIKNVVPVQA